MGRAAFKVPEHLASAQLVPLIRFDAEKEESMRVALQVSDRARGCRLHRLDHAAESARRGHVLDLLAPLANEHYAQALRFRRMPLLEERGAVKRCRNGRG